MKKAIFLMVLCILLFCPTNSFSKSIDPDKFLTQYIHNQVEGIKDVNDILQDKTGYIWVATYTGLVRYNGSEVETFNKSNREDFKASSAISLAEGRNGVVWIGTNEKGL